ncbi:MAG: nucleoside deaminase [Ornithinimicrobium sp.]
MNTPGPSSPDPALPGWAAQGYAAWMRRALSQASLVAPAEDGPAAASDEPAGPVDVPVGAVVIDALGEVIGQGHNIREAGDDPTGHAEIVALRGAGERLHTWRLSGCTLVVTLEPCAMCAGAALLGRVDRIVFGAFDAKAGACGSVWDLPRDRRSLHWAEVVAGVLESDCQAQLSEFFAARRLR